MFLLWSIPIAFAYFYAAKLVEKHFMRIASFVNGHAKQRNINFDLTITEGRFSREKAKVGGIGIVCGFLFAMLFLVTKGMVYAHSPVSPLFMCCLSGSVGAVVARYLNFKQIDKAELVVWLMSLPVIFTSAYLSVWMVGNFYYRFIY